MEAAPPSSPQTPGDALATGVLVAAAQRGDRQALEALFSRYLPRVRKIVAFRFGYSPQVLHEREDVVQEALLSAFRSLPAYTARSEAGFRNWIARCVENRLIDLRRQSAAKKRRMPKGTAPGGSAIVGVTELEDRRQATPSQIVQARELGARLEAALLELPAHVREVIILRHLCGMSYVEIAEELGFKSEGTARATLMRATTRLYDKAGVKR